MYKPTVTGRRQISSSCSLMVLRDSELIHPAHVTNQMRWVTAEDNWWSSIYYDHRHWPRFDLWEILRYPSLDQNLSKIHGYYHPTCMVWWSQQKTADFSYLTRSKFLLHLTAASTILWSLASMEYLKAHTLLLSHISTWQDSGWDLNYSSRETDLQVPTLDALQNLWKNTKIQEFISRINIIYLLNHNYKGEREREMYKVGCWEPFLAYLSRFGWMLRFISSRCLTNFQLVWQYSSRGYDATK